MKLQIYLVATAVLSSSCLSHPTDTQLQQINGDSSDGINRDPKYLFPQFITIRNIECQRQESDGSTTTGECLTLKDCNNKGGEGWKPCLLGIGVCCNTDSSDDNDDDSKLSCDDTMKTSKANFTNPGYPTKYKEAGSCKLNIDLVNDSICQLHIKFNDFELDQPDATGACKTDYFKVTGTVNDLMYPKLCGYNNDQHIYVDVDPSTNKPKITVFTGSDDVDRTWDVEIEQIACDSANRAPQGCLQYYKDPIGEIKSFNFKPIKNFPSANQHLSNLDYGICFASAEYCSIRYEKNPDDDKYGFILGGNPIDLGLDLSIINVTLSEDAALVGAACNEDYVVIPQGKSNHLMKETIEDRYCGPSFPAEVATTPPPFLMYVHTDDIEGGDLHNNGFRLQYTMSTDCTV